MSDSEKSSSQSERLRQTNAALLKGAGKDRSRLMTKRNEKLQGGAVGEEGKSQTSGVSPSERFIATTMPCLLGNGLVQRTTLMKDRRPRKTSIEQREKLPNVEADISDSGRRTLISLLSSADGLLTTVVTTHRLPLDGVIPYSRGNETESGKPEGDAVDIPIRPFSSNNAFENHKSISGEKAETGIPTSMFSPEADMQNVETHKFEGCLERSKSQLRLHNVETTRSLAAESEKDDESECLVNQVSRSEEVPVETLGDPLTDDCSEKQSKRASMYGELGHSSKATGESASLVSNSTIKETLRTLAGSKIEQVSLTSMTNEGIDTNGFTVEETKVALSDGARSHEENLSLRKTEAELSDSRAVTIKSMLAFDNALSASSLHIEDNVPAMKKADRNEQLQVECGLSSQYNALKRTVEIANEAAQNTLKIIWFLLKAIHVLLTITVAATGVAAGAFATMLLFVQAVHQWTIDRTKCLNADKQGGAQGLSYGPIASSLHSCSRQQGTSAQPCEDILRLSGDKEICDNFQSTTSEFHSSIAPRGTPEGRLAIRRATTCAALYPGSPGSHLRNELPPVMLHQLDTDQSGEVTEATGLVNLANLQIAVAHGHEVAASAISKGDEFFTSSPAANISGSKAKANDEETSDCWPFPHIEGNRAALATPNGEQSSKGTMSQAKLKEPLANSALRAPLANSEREEMLRSISIYERKEKWVTFDDTDSLLAGSTPMQKSVAESITEDNASPRQDEASFEANGLWDRMKLSTAGTEIPMSSSLMCEEIPRKIVITSSGQSGASSFEALYSPGNLLESRRKEKRKAKLSKYYFPDLSDSPICMNERGLRTGVKKRPLTVRKGRCRNTIQYVPMACQSSSMDGRLSSQEEENDRRTNNAAQTSAKKPKNRKLDKQGAVPYKETRASILRKAMIKEKLKQRDY